MGLNAKLLMFLSSARTARGVDSSWQCLTVTGAAGGAASVADRTSSRNCSEARPSEWRQSHGGLWRNTGRIISDADRIGDERPARVDKAERVLINLSANVRFWG